jgi:hypothetical protein
MRIFLRIAVWLIGLILLVYVVLLFSRPPRTGYQADLFQGVTYTRLAHSQPRPLMVHIVEIDLTAPDIGFFVTPGEAGNELEVSARTTGAFLKEFDLQVAVNGGFFDPFHARAPWDYYPRVGDPVNVRGLAISNGQLYSTDYPQNPALCLSDGLARIVQGACPEGTLQGLSGNPLLVRDGVSAIRQRQGALHPRTVVAVDEAGKRLWLVVIDGRQDYYSEGVTLAELADIIVSLGADTALNLDGGGSTTLAIASGGRTRVLNAPIHTRIPMRQRPIANHLGIYAQPLE